MEEKYNILDQLKRTAKPEVPEGFFERSPSKILGQIEGLSDDIQIQKRKQAEVPADFFENFSGNLMEKIKSEESAQSEPTRVWPMKLVGFVTAVAACALIFFIVQPSEEEEALAETTTEYEVEDENVDSYLAYLDEDEIVDFLLENEDIEIGDELTEEEEDEYYFLEEDLEELYFEGL